MTRWRMWAASAIGATAAGAGLAVARRRRSEAAPAGGIPAPPPPPAAPPAGLPNEGSVPPGHAPAEDDPQAALDAARDRLRDRADALRREIESADGHEAGDA